MEYTAIHVSSPPRQYLWRYLSRYHHPTWMPETLDVTESYVLFCVVPIHT